jgi:hypothetical protein
MEKSMANKNATSKPEAPAELSSSELLGDVTWEEIITAGEIVCAAHEELLKAADELSEKLSPLFWGDDVLKQCLPLKAGERRNSKRITDWLESKKSDIEEGLKQIQEQREEQAKRKALLNKLKLTDDEKRLLGIEGRAS